MDQKTKSLWIEEYLSDPKACRTGSCNIRYVHLALLVKRGKILAQATNGQGTRSRGSGYSTHGIHAEKNCVKRLGDVQKMRGADMIVMRFSKHKDRFLNSTPCEECELFLKKCMREYGLKNVYYTAGI
jgi:hypothetical protein